MPFRPSPGPLPPASLPRAPDLLEDGDDDVDVVSLYDGLAGDAPVDLDPMLDDPVIPAPAPVSPAPDYATVTRSGRVSRPPDRYGF